MIKIFRKTRQKFLAENKFSKYLVYAIGEIILVVIGILIALQINNWNESRKDDLQLQEYEQSLIGELRTDLARLKALDSVNSKKKKAIKNYFDYYHSENPESEVLLQEMNSLDISKRAFYTTTYTIEDLITTGNLTLFPESKRIAILKLKNVHEQYSFYESSSMQDVALYEQEIKKNFDLVLLTGLSGKEREETKSWELNPESNQLRILNNSVVESLKLFEFQSELYQVIIKETTELLELLSKNNKG
ncbi:DUF6090 family protein [Flavobacteriaceae bacterium 3-367]